MNNTATWPVIDGWIPIGTIITVEDPDSGKRFKVKRTMGTLHADVEPLTSTDTRTIEDLYPTPKNFKTAPFHRVVVHVGGHELPAALMTYPHDGNMNMPGQLSSADDLTGYSSDMADKDSDIISNSRIPNRNYIQDNDSVGHMCLYFRGSLNHVTEKPDPKVQRVLEGYKMRHFMLFEEYITSWQDADADTSIGGAPESHPGLKLSPSDRKRLLDLDRRYADVYEKRDLDRMRTITNKDEEKRRFFDARKRGECYNPIFDHLSEEYTKNGSLKEAKDLLDDFRNFDCFISEFYIGRLDYLVTFMELMTMDKNSKAYADKLYKLYPVPDPHLVDEAKRLVMKHPFEKVDEEDRPLDAKAMKAKMDEYIKKVGYDKWKVYIVDDIAPRMNIKDEYKVNINQDAKFSERDFEGLIQHEIEGHVGRRFYGDKTGLMIFRNGLMGKNWLDEGMAIWNSLNRVDHPKPNIIFNISLYAILTWYLDKLDFCGLFDKGLEYGVDEDTLWKKISRMKRFSNKTSCLVGDAYEADYLKGYLEVNKMNDKQRDLVLKYQVGPEQFRDIPKIHSFLKVNGFIDKDF